MSSRTGTGRHHLGIVAGAATLLASVPMVSLFQGLSWLGHAGFAVAMIVGAATGARALRAPVTVQALAMLGALVLAATWMFRSGEELLLLPTAGTLAHANRLLAGVPDVVTNEAVPVATGEGVLLITVLGIGLVAIMVDLAAVGARRPALAGLPMLAVYSVPVAVNLDSVPWWTFVIGVAGFLWLLGADNLDRVRRFGRRFTGDGRDVEPWEPSPLASAGRRLTVIGLLIAVALPLVVPGMTTGLVERFGSGLGSGAGGSGRSPTGVNLFAALDGLLNRDETIELVRFATDDPEPFYLRIGVADVITEQGFDHRAPDGAPVTEGLPGPRQPRTGLGFRAHRAQLEILGWDMNRAPVFAELSALGGLGGEWQYDPQQQVVFAENTGASGLRYEIAYQRPIFDPDALRRARTLPQDDPIQRQFAEVIPQERVSAQVAQLVEGINSPYERVLAILAFFSRENGFTYSLNTGSEVSGSAIVDFLFENQSGFCVQYAAAMTWMVREAGLPARVAVGFTRGNQRTGNTYLLTNHNLHAWTEVYLDEFGWVPFDATPRASIAGSANPAWAPDPNTPPELDNPGGPLGEGSDNPNTPLPGDNLPNELAPDPGGGPLGERSDQPPWRSWLLAGVVALLVLLLLPALRRVQLRRRRLPRRPAGRAVADPGDVAPDLVVRGEPAAAARHRAHAVWDELLDTMVDFQVPLNPAETPRVTADRLIRDCRLDADPAAGAAPAPGSGAAAGLVPVGDAMRLLGRAEERARYAQQPLPATGLVGAVRAVRRALSHQSSLRVRVRAALLPPSTLLRWRTAVTDAVARAMLAASRMAEASARVSPRRLLHTRPS
jgi:hypothetical protein